MEPRTFFGVGFTCMLRQNDERAGMTQDFPASKEALISDLAGFPDQSLREFEAAAVKQCSQKGSDMETSFMPIIEDMSLDQKTRYAALFCFGTWLRRMKESSRLINLLDKYQSEFNSLGTFHHLRAMALTQRAGRQDLFQALASSSRALELLPEHIGVKHSYVITRIVDLEESLKSSKLSLSEKQEEQLSNAENLLQSVMAEEPKYPKFQASQARIHSLRGRHDDARQSLLQAIDLEDSKGPDFPIRISEYNQVLFGISLREALSTVSAEVSKAQNLAEEFGSELKRFTSETQTKYLELLGIFSAVIGLVLTSVQVSTNSQTFAEGAGLMMVVSGSILIVFSAVGAIVNRPLKFILTISASGALLILGGFVAGFLI